MQNTHHLSLQPPPVLSAPQPQHLAENRRWQGIPGIERTPGGRLFALWYSGGKTEGPDNFVVLAQSDDDGTSWQDPVLVVDPPGKVRAYDPVLWLDPDQRLWLFWAQSYEWWNGRSGTWAIRCDKPDADTLTWSEPRRLCNGIMMNKPTVLRKGEWHLPAAVWTRQPCLPELAEERCSNTIVSTDGGETFARRGGAEIPCRTFDEHMIVERQDGSLWMLVRTQYGIGQSVSTDGGHTWTTGCATDIPGPNSRFHLRRLPSGRLLLLNHYRFTGRSHMTALLSEDDGRSWPWHLLLDERSQVSYPDATVTADGRIYAIYDRERYQDREILMAVFTEEDILAGTAGADTRLKVLVNRATGALD